MGALIHRITRLMEREGETFTVASVARRGVWTGVSPGRALAFLSEEQAGAGTRPLARVLVRGTETAPAALTTFSHAGRTWLFFKSTPVRWRGVTVAYWWWLG